MDDALSSLATDPLKFVSTCWPKLALYTKQQQILLSIRDNVETFVPAANEMGKDFIAGIAVLWFFASREPARVITSSSSETQLRSILWTEIKHRLDTSRYPLPFRVTDLRVEKLKHPNGTETLPRDYIIGHVTNVVENFQGHHLPSDKPRVLAIFDEASGIDDVFYEAADSWAHRKLVIGNPLSTTNFFYAKCRSGDATDPAGQAKLLRKVIQIDGRDSPNVRVARQMKAGGQPGPYPTLIPGVLSYADYVRREREWDEVKRTTRLHGRFYEGDQQLMFPMTWLDVAQAQWQELDHSSRTPVAMGLDVAAGGRDKTCWTLADGFGVFDQIVMDTPNTMAIPGRTIDLIDKYDLSPSRVAIDAGGGGKQIGDRLREQGYHVQIVGFGESAQSESSSDAKVARQAFKNRRAEMYGRLRELMNPEREGGPFAIPADCHELRQELAVLPLQYDSEGRLYLPPKERTTARITGQKPLRELLGRSPDRADSLVLAVAALTAPDYDGGLYLNRELICSGEPGDRERLTADEVEELPEPFREILTDLREHGAYWDDEPG